MSAWMHNNYHLSVVVNTIYRDACQPYKALGLPDTPERAFNLLRRANARSIEARYGHLGETVDGCIEQCGPYLPDTDLADTHGCATAIRSIDYQSCEYAGWRESPACRLLRRMNGLLLTRLIDELDNGNYKPPRADAWSMSPPEDE